jgi:hypothetical protein
MHRDRRPSLTGVTIADGLIDGFEGYRHQVQTVNHLPGGFGKILTE